MRYAVSPTHYSFDRGPACRVKATQLTTDARLVTCRKCLTMPRVMRERRGEGT